MTAQQRRALEARDPTCVVPGCGVSRHLEIDHRDGWALTRRTELSALARVCAYHHRLKTYEGWSYQGGSGRWRWIAPDGTVVTDEAPEELVRSGPDPP